MAAADPSATASLTSVFRIQSAAESWYPVPDDDPFLLLHRTFWCKPIVTVSRQSPHDDDLMDVDEDEDEVDSDYFTFNLDNPEISTDAILLRQEYPRFYDLCDSYCDRRKSGFLKKAPSVVITGQPGIGECSPLSSVRHRYRSHLACKGKSHWVFYAVRRRLGEAKPFIWYRRFPYLFVKEGVFTTTTEKIEPPRFVPYLWTFVDADHARGGFPDVLAVEGNALFNIYTSSPDRKRWAHLAKTSRCAVTVMNPWPKWEILQL
jgi:hypothetical protein